MTDTNASLSLSQRRSEFLSKIFNWPGEYNFHVNVPFENDNEQWIYRQEIEKLFVKRNVACPITFIINKKVTSRLFIRTMAIYSHSNCWNKEFVVTCLNHSLCENSFEKEHLVRCEHPYAIYQISKDTNVHCVVIPFENPPCKNKFAGTTYNFKFMCFTSCIGGPNGRPMILIFQLESESLGILGRRFFYLNVCANPLRDCMIDEQKVNYKKTEEVVKFNKKSEFSFAICASHSSKDNNSSATTPHIEKKNKMENNARTLIVALNEQTHDVEIANKSIDSIPTFTSEPGIFNWPGEYDFRVYFSCEKGYDNEQWIYKHEINELFIKRNGTCPINFIINTKLTSRLYIRVMAVYFPSNCGDREFAKKCSIHFTRESFEKESLVQCKHPYAIYKIPEDQPLYSVVIPFENPPRATYDFQFMHLTSSISGPNRPMKLIFQLESESLGILGQCVFNLKVCGNPLHRCMRDEKKGNHKRMIGSEVK